MYMRKACIYINYNNIVVLQDYLDVVKRSLENIGFTCEYVKELAGVHRDTLVVYPMAIDAFKYYLKGYCNFAIWQQGATADESYLRNKSSLRFNILNSIDVFCMKRAKFILYVSDFMKCHYESLAKRDFSSKSYVMPCFNESLDSRVFIDKDYSRRVFTYVGSLDLWQCFEETAEIYARIEHQVKNTYFKVLTFQEELAKDIIRQKKIKNYEVKQVPKNQVKKELQDCTYGFIIRKDNMVNRVATPTKISSYLAAGVIPIYSDCLIDFASVSKDYDCAYCINNGKIEELIEYVLAVHDKDKIQNEIEFLFDTYYSKTKHEKSLTELLGRVL